MLALACRCGWPATAAIAMRLLTASLVCTGQTSRQTSGETPGQTPGQIPGQPSSQPPGQASGVADPEEPLSADIWPICVEAATAGVAAMQLSRSASPSLMHLAVSSGSALMVGALTHWLRNCAAACAMPAAAAARTGTGAGLGGGAAAASKVKAAQIEPWTVSELAGTGLTPVHLAALLPDHEVAELLIDESLVACAVWLTLPCLAGYTPAVLASRKTNGWRAGAVERLSAKAQARIDAALRASPAQPSTPGRKQQQQQGLHVREQRQGGHAPALQQRRQEQQQEETACVPEEGQQPQPRAQEHLVAAAQQEEDEQQHQHRQQQQLEQHVVEEQRAQTSPGKPQVDKLHGEIGTMAPAQQPPAAAGSSSVIAAASSSGIGPADADALYKIAPPSSTSNYEDIPSPRKAHQQAGKLHASSSDSAISATSGGTMLQTGTSSGGVGANGGGVSALLLRMFAGTSYLLLLSLVLAVLTAPPYLGGEGVRSFSAGSREGQGIWSAAGKAAHALPFAVLCVLGLLLMLCTGMVVALVERRRAARLAAEGAEGDRFFRGLAFQDRQLEAAYEKVRGSCSRVCV